MNTKKILSMADRIDAFVCSQCYNECLDEQAIFACDGDAIDFHVGDIGEDEIAIPFIHCVNVEDFSIKAILVDYNNGKAVYSMSVIKD